MRTLLAAVLVALAGSGSARQPDPKTKPEVKPKTDSELIQGGWLIVGLETGGKAEPERNYRGNTFSFAKDRATLREGGFEPIGFTVTLDPTATPKTIDLTAKGNVLRGIYKLDGDDLVICLCIGGMRPTEFATKAGGTEVAELFTLKRSNWSKFTDKGGTFALDLPDQPTMKSVDVETPAGAASATVYIVRADKERVAYGIAVAPLPGKFDAKETDAVLAAARQATVAEVVGKAKATLDSDRAVRWNGLGAKEATFQVEVPGSDEKIVLRTRAFVASGHVYTLAMSGSEDIIRSPHAARFWASFRLTPEKK